MKPDFYDRLESGHARLSAKSLLAELPDEQDVFFAWLGKVVAGGKNASL